MVVTALSCKVKNIAHSLLVCEMNAFVAFTAYRRVRRQLLSDIELFSSLQMCLREHAQVRAGAR